MKIDKVGDILEDFLLSNFQAIMIDGDWGIGKTHSVVEYFHKIKNKKIKTNRGKRKILYSHISFIGKKNSKEIMEEIHFQIKGRKSKSNSYSSSVEKGISFGIPGLKFNLGAKKVFFENENKEMKKAMKKMKKKEIVIVFDDVEKLDTEVNFSTIFGLLDSFLKAGLKLIVICNSDEIKEEGMAKFGELREKIIDFHYKIKGSSKDVFNNLLGENREFNSEISEKIATINLRNTIKAVRYFEKIKSDLLETVFFSCQDKVEINDLMKKILLYSIATTSKIFSFKKSEEKTKVLKYETEIVEGVFGFLKTNLGKDWKLYHLQYFGDREIILAINEFIHSSSTDKVIKVFEKICISDDKIKSKNLFYFSEKEKKEIFEQQYNEYLSMEGKKIIDNISVVFDSIAIWFDHHLTIGFNKEKRSKISKKISDNISICDYLDLYPILSKQVTSEEEFKKFHSTLKEKLTDKLNKNFIDSLDESKSINELFATVKHFASIINTKEIELDVKFEKIIDEKLILDFLAKTIDPNDWNKINKYFENLFTLLQNNQEKILEAKNTLSEFANKGDKTQKDRLEKLLAIYF